VRSTEILDGAAAALRSMAFSLAKAFPNGLTPGLQGGQQGRLAPAGQHFAATGTTSAGECPGLKQ
jgi:hypothetical protein